MQQNFKIYYNKLVKGLSVVNSSCSNEIKLDFIKNVINPLDSIGQCMDLDLWIILKTFNATFKL